uniref:Macro domain-containing protein n=1 Tax=Schistocephalus solidus TaxID=70667 RepID=A0A183SBZ1_SCHSO
LAKEAYTTATVEALHRLRREFLHWYPVDLHVVNAPVAASLWYPVLTRGSSNLGSSQWPHPGRPSRPAG